MKPPIEAADREPSAPVEHRDSRRRPYRAPAMSDLARDGLRDHGRLKLTVVGLSMAPLLQDGDAVWVEPIPPADLRCGDVVLVRAAGSLLTHRLIAVDAATGRTKGDNVGAADPPVPIEAILGRVVAAECRGRRLDFGLARWMLLNRVLGGLGRWEAAVADAPGAFGARAAFRRWSAALRWRLTRGLTSWPQPRPAR